MKGKYIKRTEQKAKKTNKKEKGKKGRIRKEKIITTGKDGDSNPCSNLAKVMGPNCIVQRANRLRHRGALGCDSVCQIIIPDFGISY